MAESQKSDKKSKYVINSIQRKALISRIYPILLVGSIVWLAGEYLFSFLFSGLDFTGQNLLYYVIIVIVEAILLFSFFFASKSNKILLSVFFFITFSFLAGILSLPVVIFTEFIPQVHMLVSLSVGANFIVYLYKSLFRG
jgi:amino acid transporter